MSVNVCRIAGLLVRAGFSGSLSRFTEAAFVLLLYRFREASFFLIVFVVVFRVSLSPFFSDVYLGIG